MNNLKKQDFNITAKYEKLKNEYDILKSISEEIFLYNILEKISSLILNKLEIDSIIFAFKDNEEENLIIEKINFIELYKEINIIKKKLKFSLKEKDFITESYLLNKNIYINEKNIKNYSDYTQTFFNQYKIKYFVSLPITRGNEVLGVLCLINHEKEIPQKSIGIVSDIINTFYKYIKNAFHYTRLQEKQEIIKLETKKNEKFFQLIEKIYNLNYKENILDIFLKDLITIFDLNIGFIFLEEIEGLTFKNSYVDKEKYEKYKNNLKNFLNNNISLKSYDISIVECFIKKNHLIINDIEKYKTLPLSEYDKNIIKIFDNNIKTRIILPICYNNKSIGIIELISIEENIKLKDLDLKVLLSLCKIFGIIMFNINIYTDIENQKRRVESIIKELEIKNKEIIEDLKLAKKIQNNIINCDLKDIKELDIFVSYKPIKEVGGDIYDIYKLKENYYRFFLADATGHGIQAAMITMLIKAEYDKIKTCELSPEILLKIFNNIFFINYQNVNIFFTCIILDIDITNNKIFYSSAGHPSQYIINKNNLLPLYKSGPMIGLIKDFNYEKEEIDFYKSSKLILFTDGLYEEFNETKKIDFGEKRLIGLFNDYKKNKIQDFCNKILENLLNWLGGENITDDITLIGIERI